MNLLETVESHGVYFQLFAGDTQFYLSLGNMVNSERIISEVMTDVMK